MTGTTYRDATPGDSAVIAAAMWLVIATAGCGTEPAAGDPDGGGFDAVESPTDGLIGASDASPTADSGPTDTGPSSDAGAALDGGAPPSTPGLVATTEGLVQGVNAGLHWAYKGIPFATPPVGDLRWRPPVAATWRDETLLADTWGSACSQRDTLGQLTGSEDCLTLNIWAPAADPAQPTGLPVMFFIHGGSHVRGASNELLSGVRLYDGAQLAEHGGVVVVTLNYRVGALGFMAHPAMAAESEHGAAGNYGILDQILALQWTHDNIAAFGGDPDRVTVFGQSAGAYDTCILLTSPLAQGLADRALLLSGHCTAFTPEVAGAAAAGLSATLGCETEPDIAACLRAIPADQVTAAPMGFYGSATDSGFNGPTLDGWVVPEPPLDVITRGDHADIPLILSTTADEYSTMLGLYDTAPVATEEDYIAAVEAFATPQWAYLFLERYPAADYATPNDALVALYSDWGFHCPARRVLRAAVATQSQPVRRALYTHTMSWYVTAPYRAGHGLDLIYGFKNLGYPGWSPTEDELQMADAMIGYWTRFAATGDPNGLGAEPWPLYDATADPYLEVATTMAQGEGVRSELCDFWDSLE